MATDTGPILRAQSVLRELTPASNLTTAVNSFIHTWCAWQTQVHPIRAPHFRSVLRLVLGSHATITAMQQLNSTTLNIQEDFEAIASK